jgi:hypothetical protein
MSRFAAVGVAAAVSVAASVWPANAFGASSLGLSFVIGWLPMVVVGLLSRVVQIRLPDRVHALRRCERGGRIYELVGIRWFKAMLRRGPLAAFNPDLHLPEERTPANLARLAQRMRDAEASHAVLFVATLAVVAHAAVRGWWLAAVSTLVFDVVMNGYPVMLQRYNRLELAARYRVTRV